jgi:steroid delta-isomerase-like uncharacterized protein
MNDALNRGDIDAAVAFDAPDMLFNGMPFGREADRQSCIDTAATFPDLHWTIEDMVAEGDKVVIRYTFRGTNLGGLPGRPATGKQVEVTGSVFYRIVDGLCVEAVSPGSRGDWE